MPQILCCVWQKEEAEGRARAAAQSAQAAMEQVMDLEMRLADLRRELQEAVIAKTAVETKWMIGARQSAHDRETVAKSCEQLQGELQVAAAERDALETKCQALGKRVMAEAERCKAQEETIQALAHVSASLQQSCAEWDVVVEDLRSQRDAAEARAVSSESRAKKFERVFAANTDFLNGICKHMEATRFAGNGAAGSSVSHGFSCVEGSTLTSDELAKTFTSQKFELERAWSEWRSHADVLRAQTEQQTASVTSGAEETCGAYLSCLQMWASKLQVLEKACSELQAKASSLMIERGAAETRASRSAEESASLDASASEMAQAHQESIHALVDRVYELERSCVEWQWRVHTAESQTGTFPRSEASVPAASPQFDDNSTRDLNDRLDRIEVAALEAHDARMQQRQHLRTLCDAVLSQADRDSAGEASGDLEAEGDFILYQRALQKVRASMPSTFEHEFREAPAGRLSCRCVILEHSTHLLTALDLDIVNILQEFTDVVEALQNSPGGSVAIDSESHGLISAADALNSPQKLEESQVLESALDAALEQAAEFKRDLDTALLFAEECREEKDTAQQHLQECLQQIEECRRQQSDAEARACQTLESCREQEETFAAQAMEASAASDILATDLMLQKKMARDLQELSRKLVEEKEALARQCRNAAEKVRQLEDDKRNLAAAVDALTTACEQAKSLGNAWWEKAESLCADNVRVQQSLLEATVAAENTAVACCMQEKTVGVLESAVKELVTDNELLLRIEEAHVSSIQALSKVGNDLEATCLSWQRTAQDISGQNSYYLAKLQDLTREKDDALIDRDEACNRLHETRVENARRLEEHRQIAADQAGVLNAISQQLHVLDETCGKWQARAEDQGFHIYTLQLQLRALQAEKGEAERGKSDALEVCGKYERDLEALVVLVESLEQSCQTWEALVEEMTGQREEYHALHIQQMYEQAAEKEEYETRCMQEMYQVYSAEYTSNQEWKARLEVHEKQALEWQMEAEAAAAQKEAAELELVLATNELDSVQTTLTSVKLGCQAFEARVCSLIRERDKLAALGDAWRTRAEEVSRAQCASEAEICAFENTLEVIESYGSKMERTWLLAAQELHHRRACVQEDARRMQEEHDSLVEKCQQQEADMQRALAREEAQLQKLEREAALERGRAREECDAALERALAAEAQVQSWLEKSQSLENMYTDMRTQMEDMHCNAEQVQSERDEAWNRVAALEELIASASESARSVSILKSCQQDDPCGDTALQRSAIPNSQDNASMQLAGGAETNGTSCRDLPQRGMRLLGDSNSSEEDSLQWLVGQSLTLSLRVKVAAQCAAKELKQYLSSEGGSSYDVSSTQDGIVVCSIPDEESYEEGPDMAALLMQLTEALERARRQAAADAITAAASQADLEAKNAVLKAKLSSMPPPDTQDTPDVPADESAVDACAALLDAQAEIGRLEQELAEAVLALELEASLARTNQASAQCLGQRVSDLQQENKSIGWALEVANAKCASQSEEIRLLQQSCAECRALLPAGEASAALGVQHNTPSARLCSSLVSQSDKLKTSLLHFSEQIDVLVSQKTSAEVMVGASGPETRQGHLFDTGIAALHFEADQLSKALSATATGLELVVENLGYSLRSQLVDQGLHKEWQRQLQLCEADILRWKSMAKEKGKLLLVCQEMSAAVKAQLSACLDDISLLKHELRECQEQQQAMTPATAQRETQQMRELLADCDQDNLRRIEEAEMSLCSSQARASELAAMLAECEGSRLLWKKEAEQAQQRLASASNAAEEVKAQMQARLLACEEDVRLWKSKAETASLAKEEIAASLANLLLRVQEQQDGYAVAAALTLECDFDELMPDICKAHEMSDLVLADVKAALGVNASCVQVLCLQRGSLVAQLVIRASQEDDGNTATPTQLAERLKRLVAMRDTSLDQLPLIRFAREVDVHGPIPETLVVAICSAVEDMQKGQICHDVGTAERSPAEDPAEVREFDQETTSRDWLYSLSCQVRQLETTVVDLYSQLENRLRREDGRRHSLNQALSHIQGLQEEIKEKDAANLKHAQDESSVAKQRDSLLAHVDSLTLQLSAAEDKSDKLGLSAAEGRFELEELRRKLAQAQQDAEEKQESNRSFRDEIKRLSDEKTELSRLLSAADARAQGHLDCVLKCKGDAIASMQQVHLRYGAFIQSLCAAVAETEQALERYTAQCDSLSAVYIRQPTVSLGDISNALYLETPLKASPDLFTSEELKNARSHTLLCATLDQGHARSIQRQCLRVLGSWVCRQECIRNISKLTAKFFDQHVLRDQLARWRNTKRRQQHRRRIACGKLAHATALLRAFRQVNDSFLWWRVMSIRRTDARRCYTLKSVCEMSPQGRPGNAVLPKSSPRITTPRESLGAVASVGARTPSQTAI